MMEWIKNHRNMALAALGVMLVLLPVVVHSSYLLGILIRILLYTMLAGSLNMINGYSGQMNLGHAGLYCIGSYTAGILAVKYQVGFLPLLFISGFVTALFGFLVSLPTIKLAGGYLAPGWRAALRLTITSSSPRICSPWTRDSTFWPW